MTPHLGRQKYTISYLGVQLQGAVDHNSRRMHENRSQRTFADLESLLHIKRLSRQIKKSASLMETTVGERDTETGGLQSSTGRRASQLGVSSGLIFG